MTSPIFSLRENGLVLRREALELGMTDEDLRHGVRCGDLVRARQGAYMPAEAWVQLDDAGRHLVRAHAVVLTHPGRIALSHVSGALAHGMRVWGVDLTRVHVVRLDEMTGRSTHDVSHHTGDWASGGVVDVKGLPVLTPATCAVGVAARTSVESGVVTIDSAYDLCQVDRDALAEAAAGVRRWPGTARLQVTLRLAQPGSESVGESRLRYLCWLGHLPRPVLQYEVRDRSGALIGLADMAWPERGLLGEFDGRVKYGRYLREGERPGDAVFREKVREDAMREATGWRVFRATWSDLDHPRRTINRLATMLGPGTT